MRTLAVRDLSISFGGVSAVDGVSFDVPPRAIVGLIGPNGAGKTTVLNSVSGFVPAHGSIRWGEAELLSLPASRRAILGIGRTFQNVQLFAGMTLLQNVLTGMHSRLRGTILTGLLGFPVRPEERQARTEALDILESLYIGAYAERLVDTLPFGVQKLAGVARALASHPSLLLLDEPAAGLNRQEVDRLGGLIRSLRADHHTAILLVEHNMSLVMDVCDRIVVLDGGVLLAEGPPESVRINPAVITAYLGGGVAYVGK